MKAGRGGWRSHTGDMVSAIIVAAGVGKRFGPETDKLFFEVAGRPVVAHTWARFDRCAVVDEVVVVVRPGAEPTFQDIAARLALTKPWRLTLGGKERQDSVWNGVRAASESCDLVAIQDGARPCTPLAAIEATIAVAQETGAAVAAQRVTDTLKESRDGRTIDRTVDRSLLWAVQTPQVFRREAILRALEEVRRQEDQVTDDTAACERIGLAVRLVETVGPNPKVTFPGDLPLIETLLRVAAG